MKKFLGAQIWAKGTKIVLESSFFCHCLKFGSLVFLELAYNDSLQQCLTCRRGKIHEKKFLDPNLVQRGQNRSQNQNFYHFLKFSSFVFLQIAYSDSLQQCLTCRRGKIHENNFCGPDLDPKLGFCDFLKFGSLVFLEIAYNDSLKQCLTTSRGKIHERNFGPKFRSNQTKLSLRLSFLLFSQV